MEKLKPVDKRKANIYKATEFFPLAKMATEAGAKTAKSTLNRVEQIANLTRPKNLSSFGYNRTVTLLDIDTARYLRDDPINSNTLRDLNIGVVEIFGTNVTEEAKSGAASAIALVQENEMGDIKITQKKELGLDNKHADEILQEFYDAEDTSAEAEPKLKVEATPPITQEYLPSLKSEAKLPKKKKVGEDDKLEEYVPPWA